MNWKREKKITKILHGLSLMTITSVEVEELEGQLQSVTLHTDKAGTIKIAKSGYDSIGVFTPEYTKVFLLNGKVGKNLVLPTEFFDDERDAKQRKDELECDHPEGVFLVSESISDNCGASTIPDEILF